MIYGYARKTVNEYGLLELGEVTLMMEPAQIRTVGRFLLDIAMQMEAASRTQGWHRHLSSWTPDWSSEKGQPDVIVTFPELE